VSASQLRLTGLEVFTEQELSGASETVVVKVLIRSLIPLLKIEEVSPFPILSWRGEV
jgi:hypothetical protein